MLVGTTQTCEVWVSSSIRSRCSQMQTEGKHPTSTNQHMHNISSDSRLHQGRQYHAVPLDMSHGQYYLAVAAAPAAQQCQAAVSGSQQQAWKHLVKVLAPKIQASGIVAQDTLKHAASTL